MSHFEVDIPLLDCSVFVWNEPELLFYNFSVDFLVSVGVVRGWSYVQSHSLRSRRFNVDIDEAVSSQDDPRLVNHCCRAEWKVYAIRSSYQVSEPGDLSSNHFLRSKHFSHRRLHLSTLLTSDLHCNEEDQDNQQDSNHAGKGR